MSKGSVSSICPQWVPWIYVSLQDLNKRQGLALLTKVGESVKHVAGGYKLRARPAEFCAMGEYLDMFSQKLGTIDRIAQRILREQSGIRKTLPSDARVENVNFYCCFT